MPVPARVADRLAAGIKRFQPILIAAKTRDVNESDTSIIVTDMLADVFGYDKYAEITSEFAIRGTFCDLAIKQEGIRLKSVKHAITIALAALAMLAAGCSTTTFTEYRGQGILEGKGGTVRKVDGIDFWENGEPDRKYRILGVIDDSRRDNIFVPGKDGAVAKLARERGGDAVVLAGSDRELAAVDNYGNTHYRSKTKMVVVKYVE